MWIRVSLRHIAVILCLLALLSAASCAAPTPGPAVHENVAYGSDPAQKMDIYVPVGFKGPRPGVELIHGGGWTAGDKGFYAPSGQQLAALGFVAFSINYRLAQVAHYPAQADDAQRALRWMRTHAKDYNLDPARVGALGDSAGGHLALILGTHGTLDNSDKALAAQSSRVQCVVDFYGPSDLTVEMLNTPKTQGQVYVAMVVDALLGGSPKDKPKVAKAASPLFAVDSKSAPTLMVTGTDDPLVPVDQSTRMADALTAAHVPNTLAIIYKQGHGFFNPSNPQTYGAMAAEWLIRYLKP